MPASGPMEAAHLPLGLLCEQESVARDWCPWLSLPSKETINKIHRESLHPWAYFLLWILLPCIHPSLHFMKLHSWPPLTGAEERGLGEKGQGGVIIPHTLLKTVVGYLFSLPSFMFLRCPRFYNSDISRAEMHLKNSCCIVV